MLGLEKKDSPYALLIATYYIRIKYSLKHNDEEIRITFRMLDSFWLDISQKALALELKTSNLRVYCSSFLNKQLAMPSDACP